MCTDRVYAGTRGGEQNGSPQIARCQGHRHLYDQTWTGAKNSRSLSRKMWRNCSGSNNRAKGISEVSYLQYGHYLYIYTLSMYMYIEPVVTMPPPDARKRQRGSGRARVAGWLVGRADAGSGIGLRRGSGHAHAGGGGRSRGSASSSGHRGRYSGPTLRGGWRYGGRRRW